jgi:hypothetical protein
MIMIMIMMKICEVCLDNIFFVVESTFSHHTSSRVHARACTRHTLGWERKKSLVLAQVRLVLLLLLA